MAEGPHLAVLRSAAAPGHSAAPRQRRTSQAQIPRLAPRDNLRRLTGIPVPSARQRDKRRFSDSRTALKALAKLASLSLSSLFRTTLSDCQDCGSRGASTMAARSGSTASSGESDRSSAIASSRSGRCEIRIPRDRQACALRGVRVPAVAAGAGKARRILPVATPGTVRSCPVSRASRKAAVGLVVLPVQVPGQNLVLLHRFENASGEHDLAHRPGP